MYLFSVRACSSTPDIGPHPHSEYCTATPSHVRIPARHPEPRSTHAHASPQHSPAHIYRDTHPAQERGVGRRAYKACFKIVAIVTQSNDAHFLEEAMIVLAANLPLIDRKIKGGIICPICATTMKGIVHCHPLLAHDSPASEDAAQKAIA